jgi:dihydrodipicolinate synthase/N-acetylneuraminate lyase
MTSAVDPIRMLRPRRKITGISAIFLPFTPTGEIDWPAFTAHVTRTAEVGLTPAVNMDTGHVERLDMARKRIILRKTREILGNQHFVAGAFIGDKPGDEYDRSAYLFQMEAVAAQGATPVLFPSYGLASLNDDDLVDNVIELCRHCDRFIAFELGTMFAPFGKIFSAEVLTGLMKIKQCIGLKHSSLERELEWERLQLRDRFRPDFKVFTGNDLAIDMVMYGSDYLLGLSSFAPDFFALRDKYWENGDPTFYEINDTLQYLGAFAFRDPVPAYKHSAAMFLKLRGWIGNDAPLPSAPARPDSDREVLRGIMKQLGIG